MAEHTTHHPTCDCRTDQCRSCRAPIVFALTHNGKTIPVNVTPDPARGNVALDLAKDGAVVASVLPSRKAAGARAVGRTLYTSHFTDCPDSKRYRRPRR